MFHKKKTFDTRDSRVVPHRSTDRAQWCLTAQFGWDAVYPPWCDRMMGPLFLWCTPTRKRKKLVNKKKLFNKKKFVEQKKLFKKTFDTRDSRVVPHRSTDRAQWCLTAQFGWDAVYPPWCDRMMRRTVFSSMLALYWSTNSEVNVSIIPLRAGPCWCSW